MESLRSRSESKVGTGARRSVANGHRGKVLKIIRDTLTTFLAQITAVILGIVATIVIARVLGPPGKGAYSLAILVPTMMTAVANLGIGVASIYYGVSKKAEWKDLASNSLVSALVLGVISSAAFLVYFFIFRPSYLEGVDAGSVTVAVLVVPSSLMGSYFGSILLGRQRIRQYNVVQVVPPLAGLLLVLILLLGFDGGVLAAVAAWAGTAVAGSLVAGLLVMRETKVSWCFDIHLFKKSVGFGIQGNLGNIIQFLNYRVDALIVAYLMDVTAVGYYSVGVSLAEMLWYLPAAVGTILFARVPGMTSEETNKLTPRLCRNTLFITILAALALLGLSRYVIILLFGATFLPALKPFWLLLPGVVALSVCKVLSNEMAGRGRPIVNSIAAAISLAVNIPLNLWLIPKMGISGASLASTVSYSVAAVVVLGAFLRVSGNSWFDTLVVKTEDLKAYADFFASMRSQLAVIGSGRLK